MCGRDQGIRTPEMVSLELVGTVWWITSYDGHSSATKRDLIPPLISLLNPQLDSISFVNSFWSCVDGVGSVHRFMIH